MNLIIMEGVKDFITALGGDAVVRSQKYIDLVKNYGYQVRMPYSKNILPGIFELRVGGPHAIRIIYTFQENAVIIFYVFTKKTQKIQSKEMRTIRSKFRNLHI